MINLHAYFSIKTKYQQTNNFRKTNPAQNWFEKSKFDN